MPKNSHHSTFHVLRYAHVRYVKCLFMNIQKQENILKISLLFKEIQKIHAKVTREFLGLGMRTLQGIF